MKKKSSKKRQTPTQRLDQLQKIVASQQETIHKLTVQAFENRNLLDELSVRRSVMLRLQKDENDLLSQIADLKIKLADAHADRGKAEDSQNKDEVRPPWPRISK